MTDRDDRDPLERALLAVKIAVGVAFVVLLVALANLVYVLAR